VHPCGRCGIDCHLGSLPILVGTAVIVQVDMKVKGEDVPAQISIMYCGDMFNMMTTVRNFIT
jgi:hypothetical protein